MKGGMTVENKPDNPDMSPSAANAPEKNDAPREPVARRLKAVALILLLVLIPAVLHMFTQHMLYSCRITLPPGTTVVKASAIPSTSPPVAWLSRQEWFRESRYYKKVTPYLTYRYYVIPNGAETIAEQAFRGRRYMLGVTIPDSVTMIGQMAFADCGSLTRIRIPGSVREIGPSAFIWCNGLREITIPDGVTRIGTATFADCSSLTSIRIPDGVTEIGENAFNGCTGLREVVIPDSVKTIGPGAFQACSSLTSVIIPDGVTEIGSTTFANCSSLASIRLPGSLRDIGEDAFSGCKSLRAVDIPDQVERIGAKAFMDCTALEEIVLPAGMVRPLTEAEANQERERWMTTLPEPGPLLPVPCRAIEGWSFGGCTSLKKVVIPDGILRIGVNAFSGCAELAEISIPDSVTQIGEFAFYGCCKLPPVTLGKQVSKIGRDAFAKTDCRITIPDDHRYYKYDDGIIFSKDGRQVISLVRSSIKRH